MARSTDDQSRQRRYTSLATGERAPRDPALLAHPEVAVLLRVAPARRAAVQHLQPHVPPAPLRRPGGGVLAPAERRDALGRRRRAPDRDQRARTRSTSPTCSWRATSTSARSSSASTSSSACPTAGSSTTRCCCASRRTASGSRSPTATSSCGRAASPTTTNYDVTIKELDVGPLQVQGPKSKDVMVDLFGDEHPRDPLLLPAPVRARRDEGARLAHRLHVRARLRDLPLRREQERRQAVGRGARGGQAARPRGDRAVPHPPHRGRHPRPRPAATCGSTRTPTRSAWATTGWSTSSRAPTSSARTRCTKIKAEGPKRQLVGVEIGGERLGSYNDGSMIDVFPVHKDGSRIGQVTSACWSPRLEKNIGYAMVPTEHSELGTEFEVERPSETVGRRGREAVRRPREGDPEAGADGRGGDRLDAPHIAPGDRRDPVCPRTTTS